MDLWTGGPVEDDEQEDRQYSDEERAGMQMEETDVALVPAIRDETTGDQKMDPSPPKKKPPKKKPVDPLAEL